MGCFKITLVCQPIYTKIFLTVVNAKTIPPNWVVHVIKNGAATTCGYPFVNTYTRT